MFYFLSLWSEIGATIEQGLRTLTGKLAAVLYGFIIDLYSVFMYVARAQILDNDYVKRIYRRVGFILGLFMLFKLSFSLIQSLIDPAKFEDKKDGFASIVKRGIISIVLLGITPSIFTAAFDLQDLIVGSADDSNNVLYRLIVADEESVLRSGTFGDVIANDLFFSFFTESDACGVSSSQLQGTGELDAWGEEIYKYKTVTYSTIRENVLLRKATFHDLIPLLSKRSAGEYCVNWDPIFSIGTAIVVIWILINYCIAVATRVVQLSYLQLIAPVPILSYISNPDGAFKNWIRQCTTTYLDLFLRLAVLYFIMRLCRDIMTLFNNEELLASTGLSMKDSEYKWVVIFLILGLLMFGKRVPELLKELFPQKGGAASLGLGAMSPKQLLSNIPGAKTALGITKGTATLGAGIVAGGVAGAITGARYGEGIRGKLAGFGGGFFRGAASARTKGNIIKNAGTGVNNVRLANERAYQRHHDGSTFFGRMAPGHAQRVVDKFEREKEVYSTFDSLQSTLDSALEKDLGVQAAMAAFENAKKNGANVTALQGLRNNINTAKRNALATELAKERATAGSGNAQIINSVRGMSQLISKNNKLAGFDKVFAFDVSKDSVGTIWNNIDKAKKQSKSASSSFTQQGGSRYEEAQQAKANAAYGKKGK